jgi:hypothetical protein
VAGVPVVAGSAVVVVVVDDVDVDVVERGAAATTARCLASS